MIKKSMLGLISIYKLLLSKAIILLLGGGCRFYPTCSEYAHKAIQRFGVIKGTFLSMKRLFRCHPLSTGYFDPVPNKSSI